MFLAYWPVLAVVSSLVVVFIILGLSFANKLCMARTTSLPERPLETYLPHQDDGSEGMIQLPVHDEYPTEPAVSTVPEIHVDLDIEPGLPYRLDSSMSPEGRREFGV